MSIKLGKNAEERAALYLSNRGFTIIDRNVRYPFGEIDIVAKEQNTLVFVEVKHRQNAELCYPYEAVTKAKQRKIILAARAYLQKLGGPLPLCRFDVVSMVGDLAHPSIEHFIDAFYVE